jgi:hypothetical protein
LAAGVRPFGVKVLTVLEIALGVLTLLGGMALLFAGFILPEIFPRIRYVAAGSALSGFGLVGLAIVDFIVAFGLWTGVNWARTLALIFAVFGIGFSVLSLFLRPRVGEFIALILDLVIVYYLMQPRVQSYFQTQAIPR